MTRAGTRAHTRAHTNEHKHTSTDPRAISTPRETYVARDSHSFTRAMSLGCRECASIITTTRALVALALALALALSYARAVFASPSPDRREITGIVVVDRATGTFMDSITRRRVRARRQRVLAPIRVHGERTRTRERP